MTTADLNGDGVEDVVVSHFGSVDGSPNGTLGVLLGNGDATFRPVVVYASGATGAASVAAADLNGDGVPDLVVGNAGPATNRVGSAVTVLLGNGDGTFQSAVAYSSGGTGPSIAIADVNGDAKPDVVVANRSADQGRTVDVLLGNGDGSLRQAVPYGSGGAIATGIAVADLNGDDKPDLIVSNWIGSIDRDNGAVGVLLGDGDGTFQEPVSYGSGGYAGTSLAISDLNRDGNQDVVIAYCDPVGTRTCSSVGSGAGVVGVLLGNGDGTLRDAVSCDMGGLGAGSVVTGDLNGDGTRDILFASCAGGRCTSGVAVSLGNGDGTFPAPVSYHSGGLGAGSIGTADLNGDGLPEVLTTTCADASCKVSSLAVLVNDTPRPHTTPTVPSVSIELAGSGVVSASGSNLISVENAKAGTLEWKLTNNGVTTRAIEGYASLTSVPRGGRIDLFVSTAAPSYTMDIFRMGSYGGLGARRMIPTVTRTGRLQPDCPMDSLGMIECAWLDPYSLVVPRSADATDWMSGFYLVKLTESTGGKQQYISFTVRDDDRTSDLLIIQTVNTYQAYNVWGGKSLYGTITNRGDHANGARRVSFNRPYYGEGSYGAPVTVGEAALSRWLENEGYDVSYATEVDLDANASLFSNHRALLFIGHDEYLVEGDVRPRRARP